MAHAAARSASVDMEGRPWVGRSIERVEDAALLSGRGRFIDDLGVQPGTLHAAILRSPHAHADILAIDTEAAKLLPGIAAVLTGEQVKAVTSSLVVGVKAPVECWPIAIDRVRYVGEPVAVVVATDRARAEDAAELIAVDYRPRAAVVDPLGARRLSGKSRKRPHIPLRKSRAGLCGRAAPFLDRYQVSAQLLYADRDLWRHRFA